MLTRTQQERKLGPGEKPEVKQKYVHMMPEDMATWTKYLQSEWNDLDRVWYDVHVGRSMNVLAGQPDYMQKVVDGVSRKRIDVVAARGDDYMIIEVKPEANMEAIGQVVTYSQLFVMEFKLSRGVKLRIISKTCDADIHEIAEKLYVEVIALEGTTL